MQDHPTAPGDELMQHFEDLADPVRVKLLVASTKLALTSRASSVVSAA